MNDSSFPTVTPARCPHLLTTLEGLLAIQATDVRPALTQAAQFVVTSLHSDKADVFLYQPKIDTTVSVIIPALNEALNLPHVLPRIPAWVHEVILVPGHSTDDTVAVAQRLWPSIRIIGQQGRGKGAALVSGFAAATGDIIVMLDADGSMDPEEIPVYVAALVAGADFVKGSRFLPGGGTTDMEFYRKAGNWGLTLLVRVLFGGCYTDLCYGYNAFWRRILAQVTFDAPGFEIETQMNVRVLLHQLTVAEVPSFEVQRPNGVSNLRTVPDGWRVLKTILGERIRGLGQQRHEGLAELVPSHA